jgi:hypothetical protein
MLFYAEGQSPVAAQLIFTSQVLEAGAPYGGSLDTTIPPIPGLPDGPNVTVTRMRVTIGSQGVTYYTRARGRTIPYHPDGLRLPRACPHGGFPFAAAFAFANGTRASASASVACPAKAGSHADRAAARR